MKRKKPEFPYELIGEEIEIVESPNKSMVGMKGKIVDETKQTLKIRQEGKTKTLLKQAITFRLKKNNQIISGKEINHRSEERLKGK